MCQAYVFSKAWHIETPLGLISCVDQRFFVVCTCPCVCGWGGGGGGVVHHAKQTVEEMRRCGIFSPQLILLSGPMIYSKKTNY